MKKSLFLFFLFVAFSPASSVAQMSVTDVIETKNGNKYLGTITEIKPGISYSIELPGGSVLVLKVQDVKSVTRKPIDPYLKEYAYDSTLGAFRRYKPRSVNYYHKDKGYLFLAQLRAGSEFGFHLVNGYKFGQLGQLGVEVGVDYAFMPVPGNSGFIGGIQGKYFPIELFYCGDILKRRVTPFYMVSAGYAFASVPSYSYNDGSGDREAYSVTGGLRGELGFGMKSTVGMMNLSVALNCSFENCKQWSSDYQTNNGIFTETTSNQSILMILPSLCLGFSFVK